MVTQLPARRRVASALRRLVSLTARLAAVAAVRGAQVFVRLVQDLDSGFKQIARQRDAEAWSRWLELLEQREDAGAELLQVIRIRQWASTGTKAYGRWLVSGECVQGEAMALWVEGCRIQWGQLLLVRGGVDHGEHHNETVFYVNEILAVAPHDTQTRALRYKKYLDALPVDVPTLED